ncbi:PEP-CTERM sorting domain-containing protein [Coleofasciculus sp.]|uniref:PEP-CTERM sorting domain-containing protein n=1 Tax=Coleofasciculus sp. TaxID=3100458 RepID=UPI003A26B877
MNTNKVSKFIGSAAIAVSLISMLGQPANAGQLHNGWNYGIDAVGDGSGGAKYDIKGLAMKETADSIFVALTGGTPLAGNKDTGAVDNNIGFGDLFFNLSGKDFTTAMNDGDLFGIRFAETNDSQVSRTGVYQNVTAMSVTQDNDGYGSLKQYYNNKKFDKINTQGTDLPNKADVYDYLYGSTIAQKPTKNNTPILNVIQSGRFLGDIDLLDGTQLSNAGLDFSHFEANDSHTFGFRFDRALLPRNGGNFISHLFLECGNDGVALKGDLESVPEPSGLAGIAGIGLTFAGMALRRRQSRG